MKRRTFILGTGSAAAGGSALLGTGAFSRVESHRSVTVQVAEDDNAYLGMGKCQDATGTETPNASFADLDDNGHLEVEMGESGSGGSGVNSQSISWFDNVFQLCNQGKEPVCLWISNKEGQDPDRVTLYVDESDAGEKPDRLASQDGDLVENDPDLQTFTGVDDSIFLPVGECVCVGIQVFTREDEDFEIDKPEEGDVLLDQIDLVADVGVDACKEPESTQCGAVGEYACAEVGPSGDPDEVQGHEFDVENVGDQNIETELQYVILDSPDQADDEDDLNGVLEPGDTNPEAGEAAFPIAGYVAYVPEDGCDETVGVPRDEFSGFEENDLLSVPEDDDGTQRFDLIEGLTEQRYDDILGIEDYDDLVDVFDDGAGVEDPETDQDAFLTVIDYSPYSEAIEAVDTDDIGDGEESEFEEALIEELQDRDLTCG